MPWDRVPTCQTRATSSFHTSTMPGVSATSPRLTGCMGGLGNLQPPPHPWKDLRSSRDRQGRAPPWADTAQLWGGGSGASVQGLPVLADGCCENES